MNHKQLLALYDLTLRVQIQIPDMEKEVFPHLVRFIRPAPGSSLVTFSHLDPAEADAVIDAQVAYFRQRKLPFSWTVYDHDTPPYLKERLAARGLVVGEQEDVMVLDLRAAPATLLRPPAGLIQPGTGAELRVLTGPEHLADVQGVLEQVWGENFAWIHARMGAHLAIPGHLHLLAAYVDGQAVSVGWIYFYANNPFASLYGGSTLPEWRGRGLYTALLAARVQKALRRGCLFATIEAGPMSGPIVRRHGFQFLAHAWDCDWEPEEG